VRAERPTRAEVSAFREVMKKRARTFRWAALLLGRSSRDDAAVLYAFCRAADDAVDEGSDPAASTRALAALERGLEGEGSGPGRAVADLSARRGVPLEPARELLAGVRSDMTVVRIADERALFLYAYLVAGTVGLMMSALLGARDARAARYAVALGVAMQLTNICRDVEEDAARDRVYLPESLLRAAGTSQAALLARRAPREAIARVVAQLLARADELYVSAERGVRFLPPRARLAVLAAGRMYRAIGGVLERRSWDPFGGRAVVSPARKCFACMLALAAFVTLTVRSWAGREPVTSRRSTERRCATG
jgi:phytoene synthase